jgi:putative PEP-CTERM system TPR-repeat lipoprotein
MIGLCALLVSLAACGTESSSEDHVARAKEFIATEDYKSATIELKNALQKDNKSAEARYLLGKVYLEQGEMPSAEKELKRALQLGWSGEDIQPDLARALLAQGEFEKVREISSTGLTPTVEAQLLATQALAALAQGDSWDAEELIDKALAKSPDSVEALLARARLLASRNELDGAGDDVDRVISLDPAQGRAWSLRGDILASKQDIAGAIAAYDRAIELQQNNFGELFKRAGLELQKGNYEAAQADVDSMLARSAQHPAPNYIQGLLHYQAGEYEAAISSLSIAEPAFNQYPLALFFLASAQLQKGNMDQAAGLAARLHNIAPDNIQGRKLLATIRLQQGKNGDVQDLLRPVLENDPDDVDALNLNANALLRDGKTNEAIELLSRVAELQPDSPVAQVRLGAGLLMGGRGDAATQHMETALELNPEFQQADILIVLNHLQKRDFPAAIEAAKAYQRRHLTSVTPYNLLGKVYQEAGQPEEARASFERALALDKGDPGANHNLAQMAIANKDLAAARNYYEATLAVHPDSVPTLVQLAMLDAREGNETALVEHLEQATAADPTALQPRVLLARFHLGKGKPEQVAPLFSSLSEAQQQTPDVLRVMAMAQLASKDASSAQFTLEQLLESTPDSAPVRHMMAMAAAGTGDNKRAAEELRQAVKLDENYLPSRMALARLALSEKSTAELQQHMKKLQAIAPDNPDVMLLQAAAMGSSGEMKAAQELAAKAFNIAPSTNTLIALATYQEAAGDPQGAFARYAQWLDEHPQDTGARMAYANNLQLANREAEAGQQYAEVLKAAPDNAIALNNQAWIIRNDDPAKALEYARRASELAPDSPDVLDTLAVVEYINKDYPRAQRSIERALKSNPTHPSLLYHSAMIAAAAGDKTAAKATLKKLLASEPAFPELADAQALMTELSQ